jgi:hypothetical protein
MTDRQGRDEDAAADMALIESLADGLRLGRWPGDPDTIVELGDLEVTSLLARRRGGYTFETTSRGRRSIRAVFSTARDARRCLLMDLCDSYRFHWGMPPMVMHRLADGCQVEDGPTGHRLTWPGGEATFQNRPDALLYSWVIGADRDTVLACYRHVNGLPLLDLGIPADEWNLHRRRRPSEKVMEAAVETPPPDDEDPADRLAIDAVLADLRWQRRPPSPVLRSDRLAPRCTIEEGPTGFELSWADGRASFPTGDKGYQQALTFSVVVTATPAEISASYRHPNGEPLFDPGPP